MIDPAGRVTLDTQAGCDESGRVRGWLTEQGVAFVERDVTTGLEAVSAPAAMGTFATPLVVAGERSVLGFRPDEIAAALRGRPGEAGHG